MSFTVELGKTFSVSSEPLGIWMGDRKRGEREKEEHRKERGRGNGERGGERRRRRRKEKERRKRLVEWRRQKSRVGK